MQFHFRMIFSQAKILVLYLNNKIKSTNKIQISFVDDIFTCEDTPVTSLYYHLNKSDQLFVNCKSSLKTLQIDTELITEKVRQFNLDSWIFLKKINTNTI